MIDLIKLMHVKYHNKHTNTTKVKTVKLTATYDRKDG